MTMINEAGKVLYSFKEGNFVIKLQGALRFDQGAALEQCIAVLESSSNVLDVVFDMTDLKLIDSTMLGLIGQIAILVKNKIAKQAEIYCDCEDVLWVLRTIGIDKFFTINHGEFTGNELDSFEEIKVSASSKTQTVKRIIDAHNSISSLTGSKDEDLRNLQDLLRELKE